MQLAAGRGLNWVGWMPKPGRKCVLSQRGSQGWGIFFLPLGLQWVGEIFSPPFCAPAEMTRPTAGAAWPGLVSPEAGRAARSRIRDSFVRNGSSRNPRRGYSSCFLFPHPSRCQTAVVGQCVLHGPAPGAASSPAWSHPLSRQMGFGIAEAVVPTAETVS